MKNINNDNLNLKFTNEVEFFEYLMIYDLYNVKTFEYIFKYDKNNSIGIAKITPYMACNIIKKLKDNNNNKKDIKRWKDLNNVIDLSKIYNFPENKHFAEENYKNENWIKINDFNKWYNEVYLKD